MTESE